MKIVADLHTHTLASSHAYCTLSEMCAEARESGLYAIAVTDHGPAMPDSPHIWHFSQLRTLPRVIGGVTLIRGAEANILNDAGKLDLPPDFNGYALDWVIASMHGDCYTPSTEKNHTSAWLAVCENPAVNCIGHCGQARYPFDIDTVVKRARDTGTVIEINAASLLIRKGSAEICPLVARACMEHGCKIAVNTDAHSRWALGRFGAALGILEKMNFPEELVINSSRERLTAQFAHTDAFSGI